MAKIQINKDHYAYCNVDDNPYNYNKQYNSSEECLKELISQVLEAIKDKNDLIKEKIVSHYSIKFNYSRCVWKNIYN